jgi:flavin-dependent dehydrogenase
LLGKKESKRDFYIRELHPELSSRIPEIKLVEHVHVIPNYSYQVNGFCGEGFICIGDAHRFIDPIFSFGLMVTMREGQSVAPIIRAYLEDANRDKPNPFADHQLFCEMGIDVLDSFWENPLSFAHCVYSRHTEYMTDMFAGRIYAHERQPTLALLSFRKLLNREGEREQSYKSSDLYSKPIESRYHPERAAIWEVNSPVESTETWMGPR